MLEGVRRLLLPVDEGFVKIPYRMLEVRRGETTCIEAFQDSFQDHCKSRKVIENGYCPAPNPMEPYGDVWDDLPGVRLPECIFVGFVDRRERSFLRTRWLPSLAKEWTSPC